MMTQTTGSARNIDEVIARLDEIIACCVAEKSRLGFFATLYRLVTVQVKISLQSGCFEDPARMERLDVTFANRYLEAFDQFMRKEKPVGCWAVAFQTATLRRPIILQHLLVGMNAHINYDLGIAAAQTSPGAELSSLRRDFDAINEILSALAPQVLRNLDALSPWIGLLDRIDPNSERALINFSIVKARAYAWELAAELAAQSPDRWTARLAEVDEEISALGDLIVNPIGVSFKLGLRTIRLRERGNVPQIITVLNLSGPLVA